MIDTARLILAGIQPTQARTFAPILAATLPQWGIDTRERVAAFLAQTIHESVGFARLEENLMYTTAGRIHATWPGRISLAEAPQFVRRPEVLANRVYADRLGNGDEASGDGWMFRGRGLLHVTGRANYRAAGHALRMAYESQPEMVAQPVDAVLTACWFWVSNGCNERADRDDQRGLCRIVNGPALAGLESRRRLYAVAHEALA